MASLARLHPVPVGAAYFAVYLALDALVIGLQRGAGDILWYPASGITLALLLLGGPRYAPAVAAASLASSVILYRPPLSLASMALWAVLVAAVYAGAAALLLRVARLDLSLRRLRDVGWFAAVACGATLAMAAVGLAGSMSMGVTLRTSYTTALLQTWLNEIVGVLAVTPVVLVVVRRLAAGSPWPRPGLRQMLEIAGQAAALAVAGWIALSQAAGFPLFSIAFLPLAWITIRHGMGGAVAAIAAIDWGTAVAATQLPSYALQELPHIRPFMLVVSLTALVLGAGVAERRAALQDLRLSEERFRALVEGAPEAIVVVDAASGRFVTASQEAERLFGVGRERLLELGPAELSPPDQPGGCASAAVAAERIAEALAGGRPVFEWIHRNASGAPFPCEVRLARLPGPGLLVRGTIIDISDRKLLEEQLRQAQRMEAIGILAGGVAHDFNNLLVPIMGYSEMIMTSADPGSPLQDAAEQILRAADRAAALTSQLLTFSRRQVVEPAVLDLGVVIADLDRMLRRLLGAPVELVTRVALDLGRVRADRGQIEQVILNLAINARDAMPAGGRLTIEAANGERDEGGRVLLTVSDTGLGMEETTRQRAFEPFFTTKGQGRGTGLGLSTVQRIVQQSGGSVTVASAPGKGSTFTVSLPRVDAADSVQPAAAQPLARGRETILLVEDNPSVRRLSRLALERAGYRVLEAEDGAGAVALAASAGEVIHLMLTDGVMPGLSVGELITRMRAQRNGIRVLIMSGYADDVAQLKGLVAEGTAFLQKPFSAEQLARKVRDVLDGP